MSHIRPIAICVFRKDDCILVEEGYDAVKDEHFFRPLGGGIEFGENSADTICRELLEEVNLAVERDSLRYLGALENIFRFSGEAHHEIVLIYDGRLQDPAAYEQPLIQGKEANGADIRAIWKSLDEFRQRNVILYPTGLLDLLR
jgi:8-oxo-dGTP pyrophosphatase MutT (NUDIX family)